MYAVFRQKVKSDEGPYDTEGPLEFVKGWFFFRFSAKNEAEKMDFEDRTPGKDLQERSIYLYFIIEQAGRYHDPVGIY